MFPSKQLVEFAIAMKGQPYWYGTCGYKCTEDLLRKKTVQYPTHYTYDRMVKYRKDIGDHKVCVDCIGLLKAFFWTNGGEDILKYLRGEGDFVSRYESNGMPDKSANGLLSWLKSQGCKNGMINTLPNVPGIALFKSGHIGLYIGDDRAIEAQGFKYGVVETVVSKRAWTEWAYLPSSLIKYQEQVGEQYAKGIVDGFTRNLKLTAPYMRGEDVKQLQEILNKLGYNCGEADGIFGKKTCEGVKAFQRSTKFLTIDGIFGPKSYKALSNGLQILNDKLKLKLNQNEEVNNTEDKS